MIYQYDVRKKDVLIRTDKDRKPEILHRGDEKWQLLMPKPEDPDDEYTRAVWLGGGCLEDLESLDDIDLEEILEEWGYQENPPEAEGVAIEVAGEEEGNHFRGTLKKIQITSNNVCYGPRPGKKDETEQILTINTNGKVWLLRKTYDGSVIEKAEYTISYDRRDCLFREVKRLFSEEQEEIFITDVGSWEIKLTNEEGCEFLYNGPLIDVKEAYWKGLSGLFRVALRRNDLFMLDGNPDVIENIRLEYVRESKVKATEEIDEQTQEYREILTIDRKSDTIENKIQCGKDYTVTNTYNIPGKVSDLLDKLWPEIFDEIEGLSEDFIEDPLNKRTYKLMVLTRMGQEKVIEGQFCKQGLFAGYELFIESVLRLTSQCGIGEIFEPGFYKKSHRRKNDYIFCKVEFEEGGRTYCYIADNDSYEENSFVVVPVGDEMEENIVKIVKKSYYTAEDAPYPVENTKHIIRKATDEEVEHFLLED